jgi:pilus assembly protein CpaB
MNRRHALIALGSALLGVGMLELHKVRFEQEVTGGSTVHVVRIAREVTVGRALATPDVELHPVPARFVDRRQVRADDLGEVVGLRVARALMVGDALLYDDLATHGGDRTDLSSLVPDGYRAVSVSADSFDGLLRPGDRVDVLLAEEQGLSPEPKVRTLVQGALVLAVGGSTAAEGAKVGSGSVVLAITPAHAAVLATAVGAGPVTLALRNPADLATLGPAETADPAEAVR